VPVVDYQGSRNCCGGRAVAASSCAGGIFSPRPAFALFYIVNLERVVRIEPYGKDSRLAILTDARAPAVSPRRLRRLKALLDERKITSRLSFEGGACPRNLLFSWHFCEKQYISDAVMKTEAQKIRASHVSRAEIAGRRTAVPFRPATKAAALRAEHPDWTGRKPSSSRRQISCMPEANLKRFGARHFLLAGANQCGRTVINHVVRIWRCRPAAAPTAPHARGKIPAPRLDSPGPPALSA